MIVKSGYLSILRVKKSIELKFLNLTKNYLEILKKNFKRKYNSNFKKIRKIAVKYFGY